MWSVNTESKRNFAKKEFWEKGKISLKVEETKILKEKNEKSFASLNRKISNWEIKRIFYEDFFTKVLFWRFSMHWEQSKIFMIPQKYFWSLLTKGPLWWC